MRGANGYEYTAEPPTKLTKIDDSADLCDPEDITPQRSELADYKSVSLA